MYTIMIADDEIDTRDNMIACINWKEYHAEIVGMADNGLSACEILRRQRPDVALIDIHMPGLDGLEVIRQAQEEMKLDTVFIILSGYDSFHYAQRAVELQVSQYLLKPFTANDIRDALQKALQKVNERRQAHRVPPPENVLLGSDADLTELQYPHELERSIIASIAAGRQSELMAAINAFDQETRRKNPGYSGRFHCVILLYSAVCKMLVERDQCFRANHFSGRAYESADSEIFREIIVDFCTDALDVLQMSGNRNQLIETALQYIHANYGEKISLNLIAEEIHISPVYLSNLFTKVVGKSITEYLQELRIERAKAMLLNSRDSVNDIAARVGYSDVKYFVRVFKKLTSVTPNTFRSQTTLGVHG